MPQLQIVDIAGSDWPNPTRRGATPDTRECDPDLAGARRLARPRRRRERITAELARKFLGHRGNVVEQARVVARLANEFDALTVRILEAELL